MGARQAQPLSLLWARGGDGPAVGSEPQMRWGGGGGLAAALDFRRAAWPRCSLQAKKTYQVYHMESVNAEAKLREAERQEEKRAGRSAASAVAAAAAAAAATATATEAGPLRKSSLKKGGRLVEKVGLGHLSVFEGSGSSLCPWNPQPSPVGACWEVGLGGRRQGWGEESPGPLVRLGLVNSAGFGVLP